jgi:hypothetical protein
MAQKMGPEIPTLSSRTGVNLIAGPYVLGTEHEAIAIIEADRAEAVQEFLYASGLVQWNTARVSLAQPIAEAMGELAKLPGEPLY